MPKNTTIVIWWSHLHHSIVSDDFVFWPRLSSYLNYPKDIRWVMCTSNMIESFHSQLWKVTKSKRVFTSGQSLLKLLFLVYQNLKNGWTGSINDWKVTCAQLMILFEDRMLALWLTQFFVQTCRLKYSIHFSTFTDHLYTLLNRLSIYATLLITL